MYDTLTAAAAREHRSDLLREAAARSARRSSVPRRRTRRTHTENHSVMTVTRSLGRPFLAFQAWYAAGEM